ncbi:preprotein translocase subunit SecE [Methanobrevibacter ruminantium M1]|uniref:Protein translocase subunit SecE n=1 Tax=Methanobrevibacter ruminantium (strain ATCC 35063 / DSM 1093 / JCM 13430 / OCM 146 / M1) TaxID=634498 RepID=D3E150_METRM|nr:protein translocase SEC61 complex subunit gamma [Methanobrevibacter ruminantium]ADC46333.1 preprotein translocase subunit SecE [Methanobrevibacter ruminantium M1]
MNYQEELSDFWKQCKRVLKVAKKPDREEFFDFSKVTAIGIAIIGVIGFVIVLFGQLLGL